MGRWIAELRGHKRAAKVHHPLSEQIKADGAEILDEAMAAGERKDEK